MTLALSRVRRNPLQKTSQPEPSTTGVDSVSEKLGNITLEGVKNSSKGSGATPTGSLARQHGNTTKEYSLHSSASAQMETRGLLSRVSVRGTLTDAHNEIIYTQIEALNSTF